MIFAPIHGIMALFDSSIYLEKSSMHMAYLYTHDICLLIMELDYYIWRIIEEKLKNTVGTLYIEVGFCKAYYKLSTTVNDAMRISSMTHIFVRL